MLVRKSVFINFGHRGLLVRPRSSAQASLYDQVSFFLEIPVIFLTLVKFEFVYN